jgi:imidazolonepropionase-like amidohydrolase
MADILLLNAPVFRFLAYRLGSNTVETVVKNGRIVVQNGRLT